MDDPLDKDYDYLILGTGLPECILAAAAAKAGKSVLHLDAQDFYGGSSATLSLAALQELQKELALEGAAVDAPVNAAQAAASASSDEPAPARPALPPGLQTGARLSFTRSCPLRFHSGGSPCTTLPAELVKHARRYSIDLFPGLSLASGVMTDTLVDSGVSSYTEFKVLAASYIGQRQQQQAGKGFIKLPCSKSDVFSSSELSLLDKRGLMKFLGFAADYMHATTTLASEDKGEKGGHDENSDNNSKGEGVPALRAAERLNERQLGAARSLLRPQNKPTDAYSAGFDFAAWRGRPFDAFLRDSVGLSPALVDAIVHGMAMPWGVAGRPSTGASGCELTTEAGMARVASYLGSLGRYGPAAFLVTMYGVGDLAQAFTRVCAVNGGIYMLAASPDAVVVEDKEGKEGEQQRAPRAAGVLLADGKLLRAKTLVSSAAYLPPADGARPLPNAVHVVATALLDRRLPATEGASTSLVHLVVPPEDGATAGPVHLLQQGAESGAAPAASPFPIVVQAWTTVALAAGAGETDVTAARAAGEARLWAVLDHLTAPPLPPEPAALVNGEEVVAPAEAAAAASASALPLRGWAAVHSTVYYSGIDPCSVSAHPPNWHLVLDTLAMTDSAAAPSWLHARERHPLHTEGDAEAAWSVYEATMAPDAETGRVGRWFKAVGGSDSSSGASAEEGEKAAEAVEAEAATESGKSSGEAEVAHEADTAVGESVVAADTIVAEVAAASDTGAGTTATESPVPAPAVPSPAPAPAASAPAAALPDIDAALAALMSPDGTLDF